MAVDQTVMSAVIVLVVTGTRHDISVKCVKPPYVSTHALKNITPSYTINSQLHIFFLDMLITISFTYIYLHVSPQLYQEHTTALSGAHHAHLHVHVHALTLSFIIYLFPHFLLCVLGFVRYLQLSSTCSFKSTHL